MSFQIIGTGHAHPQYALTNEKLTTMVETSDEWISTRTGIQQRYICTSETHTQLAVQAANNAVLKAGVDPKEIDFIICSTIEGDYKTPSTACLVQQELGASCPAVDINSACTGFIYGLDIASAYFDSGRAETILVVSVEKMSAHIDWEDRATCVLFGDGAGAALLKKGTGLKAIRLTAKGDDKGLLAIPSGNDKTPFSTVEPKKPNLEMSGSEVFKFAVTSMCRDVKAVLTKAGITMEEVKKVIPHQANQRIIQSATERLHIREDQIVSAIARYGNTSSASIPIILSELVQQGELEKGDIIVLAAFGGGLTSGACVIEY